VSLSVLYVHNRYQERGGEDSVFEAESALFESRGHRVARLEFDNKNLPENPSMAGKLKLAADTIWSRSARKRLQSVIDDFQPDIVHFHNTLPQVSPAAYRIARSRGAAVLQTLHNFRLVCPSGLMYRDGKPCESCVGQSFAVSGIVHGCYRGSRSQTASVAAMLSVHRALGTWHRDVDLYLSCSAFAKEKVTAGGYPADKIMVKPNFVYPDLAQGDHTGDYVLYASRVTETKGIETLLRAYAENPEGLPPLRVVHGGDMLPLVEASAARDPRISSFGQISRDEVLVMMREARALVFPSIWYENFPMAITEAFAVGLPVIGSRIGALPELIQDGVNGLLFEPRNAGDLAEKLRRIAADDALAAEMGQAARDTYVSRYSVDIAYELLLTAYLRAARRPLSNLKQTPEAHVI
jgi:glycosyltransferase involved in cell wall biosynthesis